MANRKAGTIIFWTALGLINLSGLCSSFVTLGKKLERNTKITAKQEQTDSVSQREDLEQEKESTGGTWGLMTLQGLGTACAFLLVGSKSRE